MVKAGFCYDEISQSLKARYGCVRGFSVANIRVFCREFGISFRRNVVDDDALQFGVQQAVSQVSNYNQ